MEQRLRHLERCLDRLKETSCQDAAQKREGQRRAVTAEAEAQAALLREQVRVSGWACVLGALSWLCPNAILEHWSSTHQKGRP
jgi:hypothetical protein